MTLKSLMEVRGLNQSQLAKLAGVSRQAVSLWFRAAETPPILLNLRSKTLFRMAKELGVRVDDLCSPLPLEEEQEKLRTEFLWDHLYESLLAFLMAILRKEPRALARLVQVRGIFQAAKISNKCVWQNFPEFKKFIEPRQREGWEQIWTLQKDLGLI